MFNGPDLILSGPHKRHKGPGKRWDQPLVGVSLFAAAGDGGHRGRRRRRSSTGPAPTSGGGCRESQKAQISQARRAILPFHPHPGHQGLLPCFSFVGIWFYLRDLIVDPFLQFRLTIYLKTFGCSHNQASCDLFFLNFIGLLMIEPLRELRYYLARTLCYNRSCSHWKLT